MTRGKRRQWLWALSTSYRMRKGCWRRWRAALGTEAGKTPVLSAAQQQLVRDIIDRVLPGAEVWIFGSRATGRARPFSDLDLRVTRPSRLSWSERAALRDGFEASDLPFLVDVVEAEGLGGAMALRIANERLPIPPSPQLWGR